jgi:EAL domain-containing protein (putative c-di-GMP-specific phosphodiesterase class I)
MIPPGKFIPVAEDSGMVDAIGQLVLRKACEFAKVLSGHGIDLKLAVNVAPQQFVHNSLERNVRDVLLETGISPANLELEITESSFMSNQHNAITVLRHLRKLGVTIAIDDFGTGWSSLAYLSEFPLDVLKIDKSFVDKVLSGNTKLVEAIISIAKSLDLEIVAEGVETEAQIDFMRQHNVRIVQGYYFARPMPADDFLEFVREFK